MAIVTLKEREANAVRERTAALLRVKPLLADVARQHGGRFWLFGSVSRGDVRRDSDIDLLADFPAAEVHQAILAAEAVCASASLPCDIIEKNVCTETFLDIISPDLKAFP